MSLPTGSIDNNGHNQPASWPSIIRTRTTWGQWLTALAAVITAGAVLWLAMLHTVTLTSLGSGWDDEDFQQGVKEATCVTYANAVLDLAKQGYTPAQVSAVYLAAAKPADPEDAAEIAAKIKENGPTTSVLMNYCGTPANILSAATSK